MKTAIVTGCAGGIGFATVKKLTAAGIKVLGMDICPSADVTEKFMDFGGCFKYFSGNLADSADRKSLLNEAKAFLGRIDILVNVAGVAPKVRNDILEMTEESYDRVMDINAKGTMFLSQIIAKDMLSNELCDGIRGYIVNISSMSAYTSSTSRGEYCISKAGVSMVTKLFADRLAGEGILVNEIRPGIIMTGMTSTVKEKYDKLIEGGLLPIKRWGMPEDIADAVYVLCSGQLKYVTGQSIDVDGGFHIQRL